MCQNNFGYTIFNRETILNQKTIYLKLTDPYSNRKKNKYERLMEKQH